MKSVKSFKIRFGSDCHNEGGISVQLKKIKVHRSYDRRRSFDYDIAILKLSRSLQNLIPTVGVVDQNEIFEIGTPIWIAGWGHIRESEYWSTYRTRYLHSAETKLLDFDKCNKNLKGKGHPMTDRMICAGDFAGGVDTCQGLVDFKNIL